MIETIKYWFSKKGDKKIANLEFTIPSFIEYAAMRELSDKVAEILAQDIRRELLKDSEQLEKLTSMVRESLVKKIFKD